MYSCCADDPILLLSAYEAERSHRRINAMF